MNAQKALSIQGKKLKDGVIYLTFDGKILEYFTPDKTADSKKNVDELMTFALKDGHFEGLASFFIAQDFVK